MTNTKSLCLNMIVKNETANLARCLDSVRPHIACWIICDTGSSDGTQDFVRNYFQHHDILGELHEFPFVNFEQARNEALARAQASTLNYDYLLFDDADMELVVEDPGFRKRLNAPGYRLLQRGRSISYWNTRLARRDAGVRYYGVTHEFLHVPGGVQQLHEAWYKDHESGANRPNKFVRDARLLTDALQNDPGNHRYWYYLAQSYRDAGRTTEAAAAYAKRAGMGGWDEEAWNARLHEARCLLKLGDEGGFLRAALTAFNARPQRAEPLYDIARFYRDRGMFEASVLFSEPALGMRPPEEDVLFVEDFVYEAGIAEEYSIAANYARDPARKERGFVACNYLALNREIPEDTRSLAVWNLHFYIEPAAKVMPSFNPRPLGFVAPDGYRPTNPSIVRYGDDLVVVQQVVNYAIEHGISGAHVGRYATPDGAPITMRNFLLRLGDDFAIRSADEILRPHGMPKPAWSLVSGFADLRPFVWRGALWAIGCVRELTPEGWCEQVRARVDEPASGPMQLVDWRVLRPEESRRHEKNWMPLVAGDELRFVYMCDPTRVLDDQARTIAETVPPIVADQFRGGSQAIVFNRGWLALIHELRVHDQHRHYRHRFVWFDESVRLRGVSRPFLFQERGIEFAAGLAWHPDGQRLVITYGVGDSEAWIATVAADDVERSLDELSFRLPER